jgi:cytochrome c553
MRKRSWLAGLGATCLSLTGLGALAVTPETFPEWAFPEAGARPAPEAPDKVIQVQGSDAIHHPADFKGMAQAVDWFPQSHPPAPAIVSHPGADLWACGYCHLPDGQGRPENASLAGLSKAYILTQLHAFASGARVSAAPDYAPTGYMITESKAVPPKAWTAAAAYYSQRRFVSRVKIVETVSTPPMTAQAFVYVAHDGAPTPLGARILETPAAFDRFEARDPHVGIIAYVPIGAVAAGAGLAASGGPAAQPCALCHGAGLKGAWDRPWPAARRATSSVSSWPSRSAPGETPRRRPCAWRPPV